MVLWLRVKNQTASTDEGCEINVFLLPKTAKLLFGPITCCPGHINLMGWIIRSRRTVIVFYFSWWVELGSVWTALLARYQTK